MPKFLQVRQNPPGSAKFGGMVHCVCCANSTNNPKFTRVSKNNRKGGKKTHTIGSGGGRKHGPNSSKNQVSSKCSTTGPTSQPSGSGPKRCDQHHTCGCTAPVIQSGGDACPDWSRVRKCVPKLSDAFEDIKTEGVGEEWWEILFEDIGILPTVQSPIDEEHTYAMENLQVEASSSHYVRQIRLMAEWNSGIGGIRGVSPSGTVQNIPHPQPHGQGDYEPHRQRNQGVG